MITEQQLVLLGNTTRAKGNAPEFIKIRHIANCLKDDPAYGEGVAEALGIPLEKVKQTWLDKRLSIFSTASYRKTMLCLCAQM